MLGKSIVLLAGAGTLLFLGCSQPEGNGDGGQGDTILVEAIQVQPTTFTETETYFGRFEPVTVANLLSYTGGRVERIDAFEGDRVKRGASLARIDASRAMAVLQTTRLDEQMAKDTWEQTLRHKRNGNASQLAVDQAHAAYLLARANHIDAQKNYRGALAITPCEGLVLNRYIELFQDLAPGIQTFTVGKIDTLRIDITISETDIFQVQPGSRAIVSVERIANRFWSGEVHYLARGANQEDRSFLARIFIVNKDGALLPGISGRVRLDLRTHENAIVIPTEVITIEGITHSVMVIDSDGRASRRFIMTGAQTDTTTLVTDGLSSGDCIITAGQALVTDGTPVKIQQQRQL